MSRIKQIDGVAVVDGKRPITIQVIDADIRGSNLKHSESCVAARAVCRLLGAVETRVHLSRIYIKRTKNSLWERYATPPNLRTEIISFDRGGGFDTGQYRLTPVQPTNRDGGRAKYGTSELAALTTSKRPKPTKRHRSYNTTSNVRFGPA